MPWSENQQFAIDTLDRNILVAAGAGSGKTSVLVERIKNIVVDSSPLGAKVDEVLVLTFTKAAAAEMKSRLISTIKQMICNNQGDVTYLKQQLENINKAQISTFHSFAQSIIKENYFDLGLSPKMKVIDEIQSDILKYKAIDTIFQKMFAEEDSVDFKKFLKSFSSAKNEKNIKDEILQLYSQIMAIPNPFEFLYANLEIQRLMKMQKEYGEEGVLTAFERYEVSEFKNKVKAYVNRIVLKYLSWLKEEKISLQNTLSNAGCLKMSEKQKIDIEVLKKMKNSIEDGTDCFEEIAELKFSQLRATKDEKEAFNEIRESLESVKANIKKYKDKLKIVENVHSYDDIFAEISHTYENNCILLKILKAFHEEYKLIKFKKNAIDFSDIEHMAIDILKDRQIADGYKKKFKYIFIDEYQDTNSVQEHIINSVKREDNLFMVGDIKQSIYRFRMADPDIFESKYMKFADWQLCKKKECSDRNENINAEFEVAPATQRIKIDNFNSVRVDLNSNFRSKKEILDGVNLVFENAMENYNENARLNPGIIGTIAEKKLKKVSKDELLQSGVSVYLPYKFEKSKGNEENLKNRTRDFYNYLDELDIENTDDEISIRRLKDIHIEGMTIVDIIKNSVGKKYFNAKKNRVEKISYKDIVVLMRSMTKSQELKYIVEKNNIPVYVQNDKGYFDNLELKLMLDLLKTIDNKNQDLYLVGALASPAFSFSEIELAQIRALDKKQKFHVAFGEYAQSGEDEKLKFKCNNTLRKLKVWKNQSRKIDIEEFLWNVMVESNIYQTVGTWTNGSQRQLNLRTLIDRAAYFKLIGESNFKSFLSYIDNIKDKGIQVGESSNTSEGDDIVRMMTIHKSKGLEYPIIIISGVSSRFNLRNSTSNFIFNKDIGVLSKDVDLREKTKKKTVIQKAVSELEREKNIEEEIRVLYVAMTRAKEKLIMVGTRNESENDGVTREYSSYKEILFESLKKNKNDESIDFVEEYDFRNYGKYIPQNRLRGNERENWANFKEVSISDSADENLLSNIENIMTSEYEYEKDAKTRSKVTFSQLNEEEYLRYMRDECCGYDNFQKKLSKNRYDRMDSSFTDSKGNFVLNSIDDQYRYDDEEENELERDKRILSASEKGNIYHRIMEEVDFCKVSEKGVAEIENTMNELVDRGVYDEEKISHVDKNEIYNFFMSNIGIRAIYSEHKKELGFKMKHDLDGGETILQGVIDCMFEEDGQIVIIDYKTNSSSDNIKGKYKKQLELYKIAVEKATEKTVKECWLYMFKTGEEIRVI